MGDYGFRISLSGQDVKTCTDLNTIVNSKYGLLKGAISGTGTLNIGFPALAEATIAHNLGYIPYVIVEVGAYGSVLRHSPLTVGLVDNNIVVYHAADSGNLYIRGLADTMSWGNVSYKYWIYADKAKL